MSGTTRQVDELIEGLRGEAQDDGGHWTLERNRARDLAETHLLESPREYILLLVRAAVRRGAPDVRIAVGPARLVVVFAGEPFRRRELENLHDAVLAPQGGAATPGLRELALALIAARSLGFELIQVASGGGEAGTILKLEPKRTDELVSALRSSAVTQVEVRGVGIGDAIQRGYRVERLLLERCCRYSSLHIGINGCPISDRAAFAGVTAATVERAEDGLRATAGFMPWSDASAELRFVVDDVWVATEALGVTAKGFVAYVQADGLRLDLSQSKVIHDEAHARALSVAELLLADARKREGVDTETKDLARRYKSAQEQLDKIVRGYGSRRFGLGVGGGALGLVAFTLTAMLTIWFSAFAGLMSASVGVIVVSIFLDRLWNGNDARVALHLRAAFRPDTSDRHLAFLAFKAREDQAPYLLFRTLMDDYLKHCAVASVDPG